MSYNDRDHADVARANAEAEALRNDLNREDDEPGFGDNVGITANLELADVTEEQWIQARTDSLVLAEAINAGLLDAETAMELQLSVGAEPEWRRNQRIRRADDAARAAAHAEGRRWEE